MAVFRVLIALVTILFYLPSTDALIRDLYQYSFHVPILSWQLHLSKVAGIALIFAQHVFAWCLLFGWCPRFSAGFLALAGLGILLMDVRYYANNVLFHVVLLALLACSKDRVSLIHLIQSTKTNARCVGWPERLVRIQLALLFFFSALDKMVNPFWGLKGQMLLELPLFNRVFPLSWVQEMNRFLLQTFPGPISVGVIAVEFFLAVAFLYPPLWPAAVWVGMSFVLLLEFW